MATQHRALKYIKIYSGGSIPLLKNTFNVENQVMRMYYGNPNNLNWISAPLISTRYNHTFFVEWCHYKDISNAI